jgi:HK97 family phage portal protein
MGALDLVARSLRTVLRAVEGASRPGPYSLPYSGGWLPAGSDTNWWQQGNNIQPWSTSSAVVEACISAYAQTIAMCPGAHWRLKHNGGRERVQNSALSRVLKHPNDYQSSSDFLLNATRQLYMEGNAYALARRNDRYEIDELHLMDSWLSRPQLAVDGSIWYRLYGNQIIERRMNGEALIVPQRDVLHVRLHADRTRRYPFPLWGQSPLLAALNDVAVSGAISQQQLNFYLNQARPSAVLQTDLVLDKDQVQALRDRWNEQSKGLSAGSTPILTAGLKVNPWSVHGKDTQIAEVLKISEEHIALAFRVPMQILGLGGTTFGSTEALMQFWIATGLGFALNHIEEAYGILFALKGQPDEYAEFDTAVLLRSAQKERIESLARGVQGGIFAPNEARAQEGLPKVAFGDEPRLQAQVVPLSAAGNIPAGPSATAAPPSPAAPQKPGAVEPPKPDAPKPTPAPAKDYSDDVKREARRLFASTSRARRHFN